MMKLKVETEIRMVHEGLFTCVCSLKNVGVFSHRQ